MRTAVTGGIGSGKSFVCKLLNKRGINIYDCDVAAKRIMRTDEGIRQRLMKLIYDGDYQQHAEAWQGSRIPKADIAAFLMASEENTNAINSIIHPAVARDFLDSGCEWMECAILYESGFNAHVDRVIAVTAPFETRVARIMARDGISRNAAEEWIAKQLPQEVVAKRADYIIVNDGIEDLERQIDDILQQVKYKIYNDVNNTFNIR